MEVDEPALVGGQPVVDEHLDPVAKVPEPEPEHAAVAVLKVLKEEDIKILILYRCESERNCILAVKGPREKVV